MHSSTSSSDPAPVPAATGPAGTPARRASAVLLGGALLLVLAAEAGTRAFVHDISNTLNRMRRESRAAASVRVTPGAPAPVLVVGNSLLVAGVDVTGLDSALRPDYRAMRFAIEQTTYHDWFFGLRRLMSEGSRPRAVVLAFEPRHLLGSDVRGEIFARYLMRTADIVRVARATDMSPTGASDLFFSNVSDFWGLRREIRKNLIGRLMPGLPALTAMMTRGSPAAPADSVALATTGATRLRALRAVVDPHDVGLVLALMPPLRASDAGTLRRVAAESGVPVVAPLTEQDLVAGDYAADGYHLSEQGRTRYTSALARQLRDALPAAAPGRRR